MKKLRVQPSARNKRPLTPIPNPAAPSRLTALALKPLVLAVACSLSLPSAPLLAQTNRAEQRNGQEEDKVTFNFFNADLEQTVRAIAQFTGRQFVIDPRVKGTITLVTERPVTKQQAYEQLLSALRLQGFTIVESARPGGISRVVPELDAKLQGGRVIGPSQARPRGDQILTEVFELQYESATNMVPVLRPLIAPNNTISAYPANNSLVITDYADNLARLKSIIDAIDRPGGSEPEFIELKHGLAIEIATTVNRILDEGARAAGQAVDGGQRVQVMAEPRTNTLILRAASRARAYSARQLIEKLDQPSVTPGNLNVVYLRNAQAVRLAQTLRAVLSNDPSFLPQAGNTGGLSQGGGAFGQQQGFGQSSQGGQQPQAQQQTQQFGGSSGGGSSGGGGSSNSQLGGLIQADAATNSLIITAPEPVYRNIRSIIEKLDVRPAQVVIESLIVEVNANKAAEFGIQWQSLGGFNDNNTNNNSVIGGTNFGGSGTNIIQGALNPTSLGQGLNIGIIRGTVSIAGQQITNLGFLARALETTANANVLSQPNIQTLDNEEAKFLVGQNVPFVTGQFSSTGVGQTNGAVNPFQTFERRDVGLQLRVKPQISEGGAVRLAIYLEVSSVQPGTSAGGLITNKRSFESNVVVEDNNFVVLSGLIEDRTNNSESRVPLLGSLPLIGGLFRYENRDRNKTNTMVFLRPRVVRDENTSSALAAERYDYMRTQISQGQKPDNWIMRGYQGNDMPPLPPATPRTQTQPLQRDVPVLTSPPVPAAQPPAPVITSPVSSTPAPTAVATASAPPAVTPAPSPATEPAAPTPAPTPSSAPAARLTPKADSKPAEAKPAESKPAESKPSESKPAETKPNAQPASARSKPLAEPSAPASALASAPSLPAAPTPAPAPTATPSPALEPVTPQADAPAATDQTRLEAASSGPLTGSFAASASTPAPTTGTQLIQVAAVNSIARGREIQRELRTAGFDAYWESVQAAKSKKGSEVIRVRVNVDRATQSVADTLTELKRRGFDPILVNP